MQITFGPRATSFATYASAVRKGAGLPHDIRWMVVAREDGRFVCCVIAGEQPTAHLAHHGYCVAN
jgi:hypothetical protein